MIKLKNALAATAVAIALPMAVPAAAQMQIYKDYEPAQGLTELTFVEVEQGQEEVYLEGLKSTWVAANKIQKEQGVISSFAIYTVPYKDDYNMVLRVSFPSGEMLQPNKERYMKFMDAFGKTKMDEGNETVLKLYNKIRNIKSVTVMREINFID